MAKFFRKLLLPLFRDRKVVRWVAIAAEGIRWLKDDWLFPGSFRPLWIWGMCQSMPSSWVVSGCSREKTNIAVYSGKTLLFLFLLLPSIDRLDLFEVNAQMQNVAPDAANYFHTAMGPGRSSELNNPPDKHSLLPAVLVIGQLFGVMPVQGVSAKEVSSLRFTWRSFRFIYTLFCALTMFVYSGYVAVWAFDGSLDFPRYGEWVRTEGRKEALNFLKYSFKSLSSV